MYGRQTEYAIAVMSRLAEVYDQTEERLCAADVADSCGLQQPFVAKILSRLSQAGLVIGSRGPGGGSALARDPKTIKLYDVFKLFERIDSDDSCPFGGGRCGVGQPCPLHDDLVAVKKAMDHLLHDNTFEVFRIAATKGRRRPEPPRTRKTTRKRESYRAPPATTPRRQSPFLTCRRRRPRIDRMDLQ